MGKSHRSGMNLADTIGATLVGLFLAVCLVGGFFNMGIQKSIGAEFVTVDTEEDPEATVYEPNESPDEAKLAESGFVKAWAYSADETSNAWARFLATVCNLKESSIELKEDGTASASIGEQEGDFFWELKDDTHAVLFDQEGNPHELVLDGETLRADFISEGFSFTEAEEEEEA